MSVSELHPSYTQAIQSIKVCRDVYAGQDAIKKQTGGVTPYLPMYVPADQARYDRVIELSNFTNYTGFTVDKLVGAAFNEAPKTNIDTRESISYMLEDANGSGGDLHQVARSVVQENTITGRLGLLVNYPYTGGQTLSKQEVKALDLKASIHQYPAEAIPNWGVKNGRLDYINIRESKLSNPEDKFSHDTDEGNRIYYMGDDNLCYQQYVEDGGAFVETEGVLVTDFNGNGFREIPFTFVGAVDNSACVDKPPIRGMADVNVNHYQISVIEMENLSIHGQLTLAVTTSHSVKQFAEANPKGVKVGATTGINLGAQGGLHTATAPESSALPAAKKEKVVELVALGANLIDKSANIKTATEAGINAKEQTSIMQNVVNNSSDAIERCVFWASQMMGANPVNDIEYRISTEFYGDSISPELFTSFLQGVDRDMFDADAQQQVVEQTFPTVSFNENSVEAAKEGQ